eukprot:349634-Chlamydomonas_euryale.AAC.12
MGQRARAEDQPRLRAQPALCKSCGAGCMPHKCVHTNPAHLPGAWQSRSWRKGSIASTIMSQPTVRLPLTQVYGDLVVLSLSSWYTLCMATVGLHATVYRAHARSTSGCPRIQIQYRIQHRPQAGSSTSSTGTKNETRPLHPLLSLFVKIAWQDLPFGIRRPVSSDVMLVAPAAGILALQHCQGHIVSLFLLSSSPVSARRTYPVSPVCPSLLSNPHRLPFPLSIRQRTRREGAMRKLCAGG